MLVMYAGTSVPLVPFEDGGGWNTNDGSSSIPDREA